MNITGFSPAFLLSRVLATVGLLCACTLSAATHLWTGAHPNKNTWSTNNNWSGGSPPLADGSTALQFGGDTRLTPDMEAAYTVGSVTFVSGAGEFVLGSTGGHTLTVGSGGVTNSSSSLQTITNNIHLSGAQTWNTAGADILVTGNLSSGWNTFTKAGAHNLTLAGNNSGLSGPFTVNQGTVTLAHNNALGGSNYGNTVASGGTLALQGGITVNEGDLTISGTGAGGGGALRNVSGNNTLNADLKLGANASVVSAAGQLTLAKEVSTNGHIVTLDGAGDIVVNGQFSGSGRLVVSGSGDRVFNGAINSSGGLTVNGSGSSTFNQAVNVWGGPITVTSGDVNFGAAINAATYTQTGGSATFTGDGNVTINNFNITGGQVVFDKDSGHLRSDSISIANAEVVFEGDNQIFQWDDVTLADGAVLNLNDTIQTIDKLTVTGNAIIDFGEGGSNFSINDLILTGETVLTITNWTDTLDEFFANYNPGSSSLAKVIFDGYGEAVWDPYSGSSGYIVPGAPVPEPASYGALFVTALLTGLGCRRRRRAARSGNR